MAKTKPTSIRFDENDLVLAQNLSGVKKPQKLVDLLISEYVKPLKGRPIELPKDFMEFKEIGILKKDGKVEKLIAKSNEVSNSNLKIKKYDYSSIPENTPYNKKKVLMAKIREEQDKKQ